MVSRVLGYVRDFFIARIFGAGPADRRLLRRLQDPQPAAPPVRRRRVLAGLRADPGRVQEPRPARGDHVADRRASPRCCSSRWCVTAALGMAAAPLIVYLTAPGFAAEPGQVRAHGGAAAHHVPLHRLHLAGRAVRRHPEHLEPLLGAGDHAGAAQRRVHRRRGVLRRALRSAGAGARLGGVRRRRCCSSPSRCRSCVKLGLLPRWRLDLSHPGVRRVLLLMAPAAFGVSVSQVSLLINQIFASFLATGSVSWLYYADRLMELPAGVLGVARRHHPAAEPVEVPRRRATRRSTAGCSTGACA